MFSIQFIYEAETFYYFFPFQTHMLKKDTFIRFRMKGWKRRQIEQALITRMYVRSCCKQLLTFIEIIWCWVYWKINNFTGRLFTHAKTFFPDKNYNPVIFWNRTTFRNNLTIIRLVANFIISIKSQSLSITTKPYLSFQQ